ncbi:unnamed protein product [Amaranthus hypochondriacus]
MGRKMDNRCGKFRWLIVKPAADVDLRRYVDKRMEEGKVVSLRVVSLEERENLRREEGNYGQPGIVDVSPAP